MTWSQWIDLGIGIGVGVSVQRLWQRLGKQRAEDGSTALAQKAQQEVAVLLEQLKAKERTYQVLQEMSQFKAGFLARTTHELRSPLNSLIGLLQLILSDLCDNPDEEREFVAQAHESALKLLKLLDEVLGVARTEYGTNPLFIQPLQLTQVLEEVYQITHLVTANRNFPFEVLPPSPEIYVLADPQWLRQILVSLIDVSISFMEDGNGSLSLSAQPTANTETVNIWLDVQLPVSTWSEPIDLLQSHGPENQYRRQSPGLTLLLNQTLLELMQGRLSTVPLAQPSAEDQFTRLQVSMPLVIPETETLE